MVDAANPRRAGSGRMRAREGGYTLVAVAVIVTVLSIAVAMVLPAWSAQIQRDREEELVFRGLQYAEAIRVFQRRFGRFPNSLNELVEVKPRSIRRLWTEPLTEGGVWQPILLIQPEQDPGGQANGDGRADADNPDADGQTVTPGGPIIGVRTTNGKTGFRTFFGQDAYSQWRFTYDLVTPGSGGRAQMEGVGVPVGAGVGGIPHVPRAEWIGRPLPGQSGQPPMSAEPIIPGQPPPPGAGGRPPAKPPGQNDDESQ
jgi:type II secretory pathway pseudopilin PulG